jgi:serine/threonine-protein kinase 11
MTKLSDPLEIRPIKKLQNYQLLEKLGCGAIAKVYIAYNHENGRYYAIKKFMLQTLQRMSNGISQLRRELLAMKRISHSNIVQLQTILLDRENQVVYAVLELGDCGSLDAINEKVPESTIRGIFYQVLLALLYLHTENLVHGDIKPSNILLTSDGRALVSDFGLGHSFQSTDKVVGSPAFQAPELMSDSASDDPTKEDVWSVGVSLYQMTFQRLPFDGGSIWEIMRSITETRLSFPDDCDPVLNNLLLGMLAVDPMERFSVRTTLGHPWFAGAADEALDLARFKKPFPPVIDSGPVITIPVLECGDSMDFIPPDLTVPAMLRELPSEDGGGSPGAGSSSGDH